MYSEFPRSEKSYISEKFNELYIKLVKQSIDMTVGEVDEYIKFWSDKTIREFHYDVSPVEVLELLKKTLVTGEFSEEMIEFLEERRKNG